jgi:hypothetical protein
MIALKGCVGLLAVVAAMSTYGEQGAETTAFNVSSGYVRSSALGSPMAVTHITLAVGQQCVLWSMTDRRGTGKIVSLYEYSGGHPLPEGEPAAFTCKAEKGGKFRQVVIDGKAYDLEAGRLFLLARKGGAVKVLQLAPDPSKIKDNLALERLAKDDPRVLGFFGDDMAKVAERFAGEWGIHQFEVDGVEGDGHPEVRLPAYSNRMTIRGNSIESVIVSLVAGGGEKGTFSVVEVGPNGIKVDVRGVESGGTDLGQQPDREFFRKELWRLTDGGKFQRCFPLDPSGKRPETFSTKKGDGMGLFTYERRGK